MKKSIFTLMLVLASTLAMNAQSLTSNAWFTTIDLDGDETYFVINFNEDGTCANALAFDQVMNESGMKMTLSITAMMPGTYKLDGKDLKISLDEDKSTVDVDYSIEGVDDATKKMMDAMIKPELEKGKPELKQLILSGIPKMGNMKIVSLSKDKLVLADDGGNEMTFMPAPENKN